MVSDCVLLFSFSHKNLLELIEQINHVANFSLFLLISINHPVMHSAGVINTSENCAVAPKCFRQVLNQSETL